MKSMLNSVSNFKTNRVSDMIYMFNKSSILTNLENDIFNTEM